MTNVNDNGPHDPFDGIAISSYLQMLEQEMKSCTITVHSGDKEGILYLDDGILIDAEYGDLSGVDAAYKMVCWEDTTVSLTDFSKRPLKIKNSLGHILLNAACQLDEKVMATPSKPKEVAPATQQEAPMATPTITYAIKEAKNDPTYQSTITALSGIQAIHTFFLFNKAGKVAVHSATNAALAELIIYCIVTCNNLKKSVEAKALRRIHLQMQDGTSLLILPLAGKIMGMILDAESSADEIVSQVQVALSNK